MVPRGWTEQTGCQATQVEVLHALIQGGCAYYLQRTCRSRGGTSESPTVTFHGAPEALMTFEALPNLRNEPFKSFLYIWWAT